MQNKNGDEDINDIDPILELRRKIEAVLMDFIFDKNHLSDKEKFITYSIVASSLLAQITHSLFKHDGDLKVKNNYIDEMCVMAKEQLEMHNFMLKAMNHREKH